MPQGKVPLSYGQTQTAWRLKQKIKGDEAVDCPGDPMFVLENELADERALVVDSNPTSRSILINQLKELGYGTVAHAVRAIDARRILESKAFDVVLCEQYFGKDSSTGQDLLDDLRRNQLLPFSTIFIMVTAEATYAKVAEAAESALDGYLLKPHTASGLSERLAQARQRKKALKDIFDAVEIEDFEVASDLCQKRFKNRGPFWLYAARIGAELMLRLERYAEAQAMFEAVVEAKTLPWAKLGVARAQLDAGEATRAVSTLERLVSEEPGYADAYDVMGRAQFELGDLDQALKTYRMACDMTPHSISRLQSLGTVTYYSGDRAEAEKILGQAVRIGVDSKMFDAQTLVLLAFSRLELADRKGLLQSREDARRLLERSGNDARHQRLYDIIDTLALVQDQQFSRVVEKVRAIIQQVRTPEFDFESATNLIALLAQMANRTIQLDEADSVIESVGLRFCTTRAMSELLAGAATVFPAYADRIRQCSTEVLHIAEKAMALSLGGNPAAAVKELLEQGGKTLNAKLTETAYLVLQRHASKIPNSKALMEAVQEMRARVGPFVARPTIGEQKRQAGGLALRTSSAQ